MADLSDSAIWNSKAWRLIPPLEAPGKVQMAIDCWLLDQYCQGHIPPTLRFYTWSPIALSLGYHQRKYPAFWEALTWHQQPIDLVRRPTGGRAVLHQGDLSYAIVTSGLSSGLGSGFNSGVPGNRMQTYRYLCEFLIRGWRSLGIELHYGEAGRSYIHNPDCFGTATAADLVMPNGAKLIGSAQLYRKTQSQPAVLQHGSMRLNPDPALFRQIFETSMKSVPLEKDWISEKGWTYEKAMEMAIATSIASAESWFGVQFITQPLSEVEWQTILNSQV